MTKKIFLIIFIGCLISMEIKAQLPDFFREDLTFIIDDSSFTITGYYYFMNKSEENEKFDMLYPFPQNDKYGTVSDVYAYIYGNPLKNALLHYNNNLAMINLEIKPLSVTMLRIGYTQELLGNKAEYILTSTKAWGKSLQEVNYTLIAPENMQIDSLSYPPDFSNTKSGKTIYYYHKEDFMPDREFEVHFSR